ncbi:MAG TPA: hypothetical protein VHB02_00090 [Acidimicrobiales bacterium]|nr:hypothetical protein [Acidimicrobiales bacterium]
MGLRRVTVGMVAVLVGVGGLAAVPAAAGAAGPTTGLTGVTLAAATSPGTYRLSFTVHQTFGTPALLAVAVPGATFPTGATTIPITCTPSCAKAPSPSASVWGSTGSLHQSGASSVVLNLFASSAFTGAFAAGQTLSMTLHLTPPATTGDVPVSVAVETAPGTVLATGGGQLAVATTTAPTLGTATVAATATPNATGYPAAGWSTTVSGLLQYGTRTDLVTVYAPGATLPTAGYTVATCTYHSLTGTTTDAACGTVTVSVTPATTGLPGAAAVLKITTGSLASHGTAPSLTGFTLAAPGVANPSGPAAAALPVVVGSSGTGTTTATGTATLGQLGAAGTTATALVASPTVDLASTNYPHFPVAATVGQTAKFGLTLANGTDYAWPATAAALSFTATGIAGLSPGSIEVQCGYEGTAPAGAPAKATFTFTGTAGSLVSNAVGVPLLKTHSTPLDCTLSSSANAAAGTLTLTAVLTDTKAATPATAARHYVLATAADALALQPAPTTGYTLDASDGGIFTYGSAQFYGSMGGKPLNQPVVGMAMTADGKGYWEVAADGGIFSFGDAQFYGSMGGRPLNKPIVGMAATADGAGYWLVASDGGIFSFGDAGFYGSSGSLALRAPVVGMAATPDGRGYWLVAADGGIFTYGDARFSGSAGALRLKAPVVGMAATPDGRGYWEVAADGGIFTFGDAAFAGSAGALTLNKPVVGMLATSDGGGYWLVAADGGIFTYGDAQFYGSAGALPLVKPVVGIA